MILRVETSSRLSPLSPDFKAYLAGAAAAQVKREDKDSKIVREYGLDIDTTYQIVDDAKQCDNKTVSCNQRPTDAKISHVMVHNTVISFEETIKKFSEALAGTTLDNRKGVSSHYIIREDGKVFRIVPENGRAWHAGAGSWDDLKGLNDTSIGIELVNPGAPTDDINANCKKAINLDQQPNYTDTQKESLRKLLKGITQKYDIPPYYVIPHSDYRPDNRCDPGVKFPYKDLYKGGGGWLPWEWFTKDKLGLWVTPARVSVTDKNFKPLTFGQEGPEIVELQNLLRRAAYTTVKATGKYDDATRDAVSAFQMRQRPELLKGEEVDFSTFDTLKRFVAAFEKAKIEWQEKHPQQRPGS